MLFQLSVLALSCPLAREPSSGWSLPAGGLGVGGLASFAPGRIGSVRVTPHALLQRHAQKVSRPAALPQEEQEAEEEGEAEEARGASGARVRPVVAVQRPKIKVRGLSARTENLLPPEDPSEAHQLQDESICERNSFARRDLCPDQCPFAAEMENNFCHFRCVTKDKCGLLGTMRNATIPDEAMRSCRHCSVKACKVCVTGKPGVESDELERCKDCMPGYYLTPSGKCHLKDMWMFAMAGCVIMLIAVVILLWYVSLWSKPIVNRDGLDFALLCRDRSVLQDAAIHQPYSLFTNLLTRNVAGAGTMCFFRYQFAILVWALSLLTMWVVIANLSSHDIYIIGDRGADTPQLLCAVIDWGHTRQYELLWTKVLWCTCAYFFSFGGALLYAAQQTRMVAVTREDTVCASSFAAVIRGVPRLKGSEQAEAVIKEAVENSTSHSVVGVSVAWNYSQHEDLIKTACERRELSSSSAGEVSSTASLTTGDEEFDPHFLKATLKHIRCTDTAFVIFESSAVRDLALADLAARTGKRVLLIKGAKCTLEACHQGPREVNWTNFHVSESEHLNRLIEGICLVFGGCVAWTLILYLPYAHYVASFSYANGDEPDFVSDGLFCGLVVGSQLGLFVLSNVATVHASYRYQDDAQRTYTLLYSGALVLNLVMDLVLQAYLSYLQMVGIGAHTAEGKLLGNLDSIQDVFESYPMQKCLGHLMYTYCWPCTFLVPFIFEPMMVFWLPSHLAKLRVRSDPKAKGLKAARCMELNEMEQGRYADVNFNTICAMSIIFVAPAYLYKTMFALVLSHCYLFMYDQVKVLRYVASFSLNTEAAHHLGQKIFSIPVSLLLGALVFKGSQLSGSNALASGFLKGQWLWMSICSVVFLHNVIHHKLLHHIWESQPRKHDRSKATSTYFQSIEEQNEPSYFALNPVHCLRTTFGLIGGSKRVAFNAPYKV